MVNIVSLNVKKDRTIELDNHLATIVTEPEFQDSIIKLNQNSAHFKTYTLNASLPERLTVKEIIKFWYKWYHSKINLTYLYELYKLTSFSHKKIKQLSHSELILVHLAKLMLVPDDKFIIKEPLQNISIETTHTILNVLNELSKTNTIVTLTNHTEQGLLISDNCYRLNENTFKPIETTQQKQTIDNNTTDKKQLERQQIKRLTVKTNEKTLFLDPIDIDYIEGQDGKVVIHVSNEHYTHDTTLQAMESLIIPYGFYRCHRSYIVNLQKVSEIISWSKNNYSIRLNNSKDLLVPLSRQKAKEIEQFFNITE
ncbi:LytTR family transcriptional regulator DNA-binding domain-containing protein [Staphylococcus caeli]|uniref:LytTR family transcriptional regulator DNA-binding domain-containing protein n=1 Tax=Staphylococcus caeli TaxID=2201815 RepID=UPI003F559EAD